MYLWRKWWRGFSRSEIYLYLLDLFMECLDLRWGEHVFEVKGKIWTVNLIWRSMLPYNVWRSIRKFVTVKARIYAGLIQRKRVWNVKLVLKYVRRYTQVYMHGGTYIRGISERKARMQTRVCWSMGYEMYAVLLLSVFYSSHLSASVWLYDWA